MLLRVAVGNFSYLELLAKIFSKISMLEILAKIKRKFYCFCSHNGTLGGLTDAEVLPVLTLATACSKPTETPLPTKLADVLLTISVEFSEIPEFLEISGISEILEEVEVEVGAEVLPTASDTASAALGIVLGRIPGLRAQTGFSHVLIGFGPKGDQLEVNRGG